MSIDKLKKIKYYRFWLLLLTLASLFSYLIAGWFYTNSYFLLMFLPAIILHLYMNELTMNGRYNLELLWANDFVGFEKEPKPGTTLLDLLKKNHVSVEKIKTMSLMACSLEHGCEYYLKKLSKELKDTTISIYGYYQGSMDIKKCSESNITFYQTKNILTEHINLIRIKDDELFICYEPEHIVIGKEDILKYGSCLVKVKEKNKDVVEHSFIDKLSETRKVV